VFADSPDEDDVVGEGAAVVRRLRNEDGAHTNATDSDPGEPFDSVRTAVEDDAAVWTDEVCEAGGLPARVGRRRWRRHVLVAEAAFEQRSKPLLPTSGSRTHGRRWKGGWWHTCC
jgi:hypothetical protein